MMSESVKGWLCSKCGPLHYNEVDAVDQTVGCTRCGGVMWGDDDITISPLYATDHAEELAKALEALQYFASAWINRADTKGMSERDYKMWLALGHHSVVLENSRKAITNYREATK